MRKHFNRGLVATSGDNLIKRSLAKKNREEIKRNIKKYVMTVMGKTIFISQEQYETLKSIGYKVDIVEGEN